MKRDAWMPLYIGDYLRDTSRLTTEGHGAYLLLIMDYWTAGEPLPDDDTQLAAVTRLPLNRWKALRPTIARFFRIDDGFWHHKRIDEELAKIRQINASRSAAGQRGAEVRWQTHGNGIANALPCDDGKPMANASAEQWQNDAPSPSPSPKSKSSLRSDSSDRFLEFYELYPRHEARRAAERAWKAALKRALPETIIAGAKRYADERSGQDKQFTKLPATWLNADCWADESGSINGHAPTGPIGPKPTLQEILGDDYERAMGLAH